MPTISKKTKTMLEFLKEHCPNFRDGINSCIKPPCPFWSGRCMHPEKPGLNHERCW